MTWIAIKRLLEHLRDNFAQPYMRTAYPWGTLLSECQPSGTHPATHCRAAINCAVTMATALQPSTSVSLGDVAWLKSGSDAAYVPKPVDTSKVGLTAVRAPLCLAQASSLQDLVDIVEDLARRSHEQWAFDRIKDGWTYAPVRDNAAKHHPMLLSYEQLTDDVRLTLRHAAFTVVAGQGGQSRRLSRADQGDPCAGLGH